MDQPLSSPRSSDHQQPTTRSGSPFQTEVRSTELENEQISSSSKSGIAMGRSLGQILIVLIVLVVLVNVPINYSGAGLAHNIPVVTPIVMYDGLLLKDSKGVTYLLEDHKLRRISSPEALHYYFSSTEPLDIENSLLEQFSQGRPVHRLLKCQDTSNVYALESGKKRLVQGSLPTNKTIPWDKVDLVSCTYLYSLPDGLPVIGDGEP
jgi:hypothetical protein